jgi:S1-C subfamily serine protease
MDLWKIRLIVLFTAQLLALVCLGDGNAASKLPAPREILQIKAEKQVAGRSYSQYGQAWVLEFVGINKVYLLTPSHVIDGADQILAFCSKDVRLSLRVLGNSPTYDLALLELVGPTPSSCSLKPLITVNPKTQSLEKQTGVVYPWSGVRYASRDKEEFVAGMILDRLERKQEVELTPYRTDIIADFSIRPGMSGGAMVWANRSGALGMATKTRLNDRRSLFIPIQELVPIAISMLRFNDPWRAGSDSIAYLRFVNSVNAEGLLERSRQLVIPDPSSSLAGVGAQTLTLTDACPSSVYRFSSDWLASEGGSLADGGGSLADGSGHAQGARIGNAEYTGVTSAVAKAPTSWSAFPTISLVIFPYFKELDLCQKEGLVLDDGRVLLGLFDPDSNLALKTDDLNKLIPLAGRYKTKFREFINKNGLFKKDLKSMKFDIFCRPQLLGRQGRLVFDGTRDSLGKEQILSEGRVKVAALNTGFFQPFEDSSPSVPDKLLSSIECMEGKDGSRKIVSFKSINSKWGFQVVFRPGAVAGNLFFINDGKKDVIEDEFYQQDDNYWNHTVTTKRGLRLHLALNPEGRLLELSILKIPESLNREIAEDWTGYTNMPIWMIKYFAEVKQ